jgi:hypothetical protein
VEVKEASAQKSEGEPSKLVLRSWPRLNAVHDDRVWQPHGELLPALFEVHAGYLAVGIVHARQWVGYLDKKCGKVHMPIPAVGVDEGRAGSVVTFFESVTVSRGLGRSRLPFGGR